MRARTALMGLAAATLLAPVGIVATSGPASAENLVHIRVDPLQGWQWSGTISLLPVSCPGGDESMNDPCINKFLPDYAYKTVNFTEGPGGGLVELLDVTFGLTTSNTSYRITVTNNVFTNGTITRKGGDVGVRIYNPMFGSMSAPWSQVSPGDVPMAFNFGKPGGNYELKFYPTVDAPSLQSLNATVSAAVGRGAGCTITGTPGDDVLTGTSGDDVICGLGGNDVIRGKGGDDIIHAGDGQDSVHGGSGNDTVVGGKGRDTIHGGKGADDISGGTGKDIIRHTKGHDWVHGGRHKDRIINVGP